MNKNILSKSLQRLSYSDLNIFKMREYLKRFFDDLDEINIVLEYLVAKKWIDELSQIKLLADKYISKGYGYKYIEQRLKDLYYDQKDIKFVLDQVVEEVDVYSLLSSKKWQGSKKKVIEKAKQYLYSRGLVVSDYIHQINDFFNDYDEFLDYLGWLSKNKSKDIAYLRNKSYRLGYMSTTINRGLGEVNYEEN